MRRRAHFAFGIASLLVLAACSAIGGGQEQRPSHLSQATYDGRLWVQPGLAVRDFARLEGVRALALAPDGAVYASVPRRGEVVRLRDADGDGVAEQQVVAASDLDRPHGMAFRDGALYVATTGAVVRVTLDPVTGVASGAPQVIARYSAGGGHWTRTVIFGPDGGMYVSIGSTCNVCEERTPDRAAVMRYDADGRNGRVFSSGLRNAVGMAVHPETREIWVTQHERDNLRPNHQDLPHEEINILRDGAHFGWPYCHGDRVPNPEFRDTARCATTLPPAFTMQAHSAPLGMTFLQRATALPETLRSDALVAYHGSWNRDVPTGAKVVRLRVRDGRPVGVEDFVVGWQDARGRRWGRPVDVLVAGDGAVLISDDQAGTIYRVAP
jgi:glucose/arabinose dehydrogenase